MGNLVRFFRRDTRDRYLACRHPDAEALRRHPGGAARDRERVAALAGIAAERWRAQLCHYLPLIERILTQTQRRVLDGQAVKASEKLVSLFEPHADIIVRGARDVRYGHKLNLVTGRSGLILDVVVETGNPAAAPRTGGGANPRFVGQPALEVCLRARRETD
jgi:hypothetical protein